MTTMPLPTVSASAGSIPTASVAEASQWMRAGQAVLFDVREKDEHAREHIAGAVLVPLSSFDSGVIRGRLKPGQRAVIHCKSGKRSQDACRLASRLVDEGTPVFSLSGGIEAWKSAGLPVRTDARAPGISIMRQVQLVVGVLLLVGGGLVWFVHPAFIGLSALLGAGLTFAGATGTCGLAWVLTKMPWNRGGGSCALSGSSSGPASGSCCGGA